ncbi:MAG: PAS domain-containing protein [Planctomycetota bacterium]
MTHDTHVSNVAADLPSTFDQFDALIELSGEFIGVCDLDRRPVFVNPAGLRMVGLDSLEDAQARRVDDFFFPEDCKKIFDEFFPHVLAKGSGEIEVRFRHFKTQKPIWVLYNCFLLKNRDGETEHVATISSNITQQKADARLAEKRAKQIQTLADSLPALVAYVGPNKRYKWVNAQYAEQFGGRPDEIIGKEVRNVMGAEAYSTVEPYLDRALAGERVTYELDLRVVGTDDVLNKQVTYVPDSHTDDGAGCFVMAVDITSRKQLEHELRETLAELSELNGRKDRFLATLAHELRNPLAPLRTGLALLENQTEGDQKDLVQSLTRQLTQVVRLVNDLLDVARISRNKIELKPEALVLQDILSDAIHAVMPFVEENRHTLHTEIPADPPVELFADRARLIQVFSNVLHNAVKYTPDEGEIRLALIASDDEVEVSVTDSGRGIDPAHLETIFHLFAQIERTEDSRSSGLGLGLTVVRSFVEMHGGRVSVESDGIDRGSTFRIFLPRTEAGTAHPTTWLPRGAHRKTTPGGSGCWWSTTTPPGPICSRASSGRWATRSKSRTTVPRPSRPPMRRARSW